jgi:hypothetical protein
VYLRVRKVRECGARVLCSEWNCQVAVTAGTAEGRFGLWFGTENFWERQSSREVTG